MAKLPKLFSIPFFIPPTEGDKFNVRQFILAGNARFTVQSKKTGRRFTYHIVKKEGWSGSPVYFVNVLTGPDNSTDYEFFGTIFSDTQKFVYSLKSRISREAKSVIAFRWFWRQIVAEKELKDCDVSHEGRCGRCGRRLTVPESIRSGFGPECINKI